MNNKKIILASASPRRKELLKTLNFEFEVIPSQIEEDIDKIFSADLIENLALDKAMDIKNKIDYPSVIIGADTVVVVNSQILGKPKDKDDAIRMLSMLSNNTHQVVSAIALVDTETGKIKVDSVVSDVNFREISDLEINNYVKTGEPMDKAGSYAIQGLGGIFVSSICGCYSNIVGISVFKLAEMLKDFGVNVL